MTTEGRETVESRTRGATQVDPYVDENPSIRRGMD